MSNKNVVYISANPIQAGIVKGLLESNGIEAHLFDENVSRMQPFYNLAVGGVKVVVASKDIKSARKLLKAQEDVRHFDRPVGSLSPFEFLGGIQNPVKRVFALMLAFVWLPFAVLATLFFERKRPRL